MEAPEPRHDLLSPEWHDRASAAVRDGPAGATARAANSGPSGADRTRSPASGRVGRTAGVYGEAIGDAAADSVGPHGHRAPGPGSDEARRSASAGSAEPTPQYAMALAFGDAAKPAPGVQSPMPHTPVDETAPPPEVDEPLPLEPAGPGDLIDAWNKYRRNGDGHFNPRGLQAVLNEWGSMWTSATAIGSAPPARCWSWNDRLKGLPRVAQFQQVAAGGRGLVRQRRQRRPDRPDAAGGAGGTRPLARIGDRAFRGDRARRGAVAPIRRGFAPTPRRPLAGTLQLRATPALRSRRRSTARTLGPSGVEPGRIPFTRHDVSTRNGVCRASASKSASQWRTGRSTRMANAAMRQSTRTRTVSPRLRHCR